MVATDFDRRVRALGAETSRRGVLTGLMGGLLGVLPDLLAREDAAAKQKRKNKIKKQPCKGGTRKCGKSCTPTNRCGSAVDGPMSSGEFCQDGACICTPGLQDSGGVCATPPTCLGGGAIGVGNIDGCCSGACLGLVACVSSEAGAHCHVTSDCGPNLQCVVFVCTT